MLLRLVLGRVLICALAPLYNIEKKPCKIIMYILQIFLGQNDNDYTASRVQELPQPITTTVVRIYPTDSVSDTRVCLKLELHGCVLQREEGMQ